METDGHTIESMQEEAEGIVVEDSDKHGGHRTYSAGVQKDHRGLGKPARHGLEESRGFPRIQS